MEIQEIKEIIKNGENAYIGALHFDISPVEGTSMKDLNIDVIREYFLKYNAFDLYEESKDSIERILINGHY